MTASIGDPIVGRTIAQYEVLARIGGGGMGVVYRAHDRRLGRPVALKFLPSQWSHDEDARQRFIREAQAASATSHQNICTVHDIETADDGQLFIVMAYYEGQTLKQRLASGPLSVDESLDIATQIADGLARAHARGVVHRDVKPGNVMLTEDGVRILDFGLATFADALKLTSEHSTLGTAAYMSPEQVRGQSADARSDVWAVGVILYEMLTGHVPFQGSHAEAIAYAVRHETPSPTRAARPEIGEEIEHLVFRAMHKDPAVRFASGRELARALRQVRGHSVPLELRTEPVEVGRRTPGPTRSPWPRNAWVAAAAAAVAVVGGVLYQGLGSIERIPIAIAPVINQTGYPELDPYRLALTYVLTTEISDSPNVRVLPYVRLQQIVRPMAQNVDLSSRQAVHSITTQSGSRLVVVPTLLYENEMWRGRAEIQDASTATNLAVVQTASFASSLVKDAAAALMADLAVQIQEYFEANGPGRSYFPRVPSSRFRSLESAKRFEEGLIAFDQLEYDLARQSFSTATTLDPRNPLVAAWLSRSHQILRQDDAASDAAEKAASLLSSRTPALDAAVINAIVGEARHDFAAAETHYRSLVEDYPDEPLWHVELGSFLERRGEVEAAVVSYQHALSMDNWLARPDVELCRLYNRLNDRPNARQHGQRALSKFTALGARWGEAQAHFCLTDVLRAGTTEERQEAQAHADAALAILDPLNSPYNLARAYYYAGLGQAERGNLVGGVGLWEKAAEAATVGNNIILEPLVLMNLGVAHARLGNRRQAMEYYQRSAEGYERLGDGGRAAQVQTNRAQLRIDFGDNPDGAYREVQNALAVFVQQGDRNWEVFSRQTLAAFYRNSGQYAEAGRELNRALAIARERNLSEDVAALTVDLARTRFALNDYADSISRLETIGDDAGQHSLHAWIWLGRNHLRLGNQASARQFLLRAEADVAARARTEYLPLLYLSLGELEWQADQLDRARTYLSKAASDEQTDLPDPASLEARVFLALIDVLERRGAARTRNVLESGVRRASETRHAALEAFCRVVLARLDLDERKYADAIRTLDGVIDRDPPVSPELRAQAHDLRGRVLTARHEIEAAKSEHDRARQLLDGIRMSLPERDRAGYSGRRDIRPLMQEGSVQIRLDGR